MNNGYTSYSQMDYAYMMGEQSAYPPATSHYPRGYIYQENDSDDRMRRPIQRAQTDYQLGQPQYDTRPQALVRHHTMPNLGSVQVPSISLLRIYSNEPMEYSWNQSDTWWFRIRLKQLSGVGKINCTRLHDICKVFKMIHSAIEITNQRTNQSFLFELLKTVGEPNELGVYGPVADPDQWIQFEYEIHEDDHWNQARSDSNPDSIRAEAARIMNEMPNYYIGGSDCQTFCLRLAHAISAKPVQSLVYACLDMIRVDIIANDPMVRIGTDTFNKAVGAVKAVRNNEMSMIEGIQEMGSVIRGAYEDLRQRAEKVNGAQRDRSF